MFDVRVTKRWLDLTVK